MDLCVIYLLHFNHLWQKSTIPFCNQISRRNGR
nr:MAG TPA: hypothetical protein [Caudoviricetes sp.]